MNDLYRTVNYLAPSPTGFRRYFAARRLPDFSFTLLLHGPDNHLHISKDRKPRRDLPTMSGALKFAFVNRGLAHGPSVTYLIQLLVGAFDKSQNP